MGATLNLSLLRAILGDLDDEIDAGLGDAAEMVADLASQLAPRDTGDLADSIQARRTADGWQVVAGVDLPDIRADVQEYGSIYQEPQPYLTPAAKEIDVTAAVAARIRRRLG